MTFFKTPNERKIKAALAKRSVKPSLPNDKNNGQKNNRTIPIKVSACPEVDRRIKKRDKGKMTNNSGNLLAPCTRARNINTNNVTTYIMRIIFLVLIILKALTLRNITSSISDRRRELPDLSGKIFPPCTQRLTQLD